MRVFIQFIGDKALSFHSSQYSEAALRSMVEWFKDKNNSEAQRILYNKNGTIGEYIISKRNILYMDVQED